MRETIREFNGRIIGYIDVESNGNKTVRSFGGKILGYYDRNADVTKDFYNKILYRGDMASALLVLFD